MTAIADHHALDDEWSTHNYHPLPVVLSHGEGAWVTDVEGRRYLDFLSGYSSLNFGPRHPELVAAAVEQLGRVTLTSRAFHHDQFGLFCRELAELTGTEMVLTMNSGAEAVESAIKVARKWAYQVKAGIVVPPAGYLAAVRRICDENDVLMIADEIQSGLGRTGELLALDEAG